MFPFFLQVPVVSRFLSQCRGQGFTYPCRGALKKEKGIHSRQGKKLIEDERLCSTTWVVCHKAGCWISTQSFMLYQTMK